MLNLWDRATTKQELRFGSPRFRYAMIDACLSWYDHAVLWVVMAFALYGAYCLLKLN